MSVVVENLHDRGEVPSILFSDPRSDYGDLYTFHHKICDIKISHSSNFNPVSITLWYENKIIIFFLFVWILISEEQWAWRSQFLVILYCVTLLKTLLTSVQRNTLYLAGCDRMIEFSLFCPWSWMNFFVHSRVQSLKNILKPSSRLLLESTSPPPPPKNLGTDNEITY